jgi:hypothetical protein
VKTRPFYRRKRFLIPGAATAALLAAFAAAFLRSDASKIILYNKTEAPMPHIKIMACGQTCVFPPSPDDASYRWRLDPTGDPGEILIESAADPPWKWQGGFIAPNGGYRVSLRVWPDHEVEVHTQISFWQRLLRNAPRLNE